MLAWSRRGHLAVRDEVSSGAEQEGGDRRVAWASQIKGFFEL